MHSPWFEPLELENVWGWLTNNQSLTKPNPRAVLYPGVKMAPVPTFAMTRRQFIIHRPTTD